MRHKCRHKETGSLSMKNTNIQTISLKLFNITIHLFITCLSELPMQVKHEESHFKQSLLLLLL